jgi:hypothetical protein
LEENQTQIKELTTILIQRDYQIEAKTKEIKNLQQQYKMGSEVQAVKLNQEFE